MSENTLNLFQKCHVNSNFDDDRFVGIRIIDGQPSVFFPIGYNLPRDDKSVRREILALLNTLCYFAKKEYDTLGTNRFFVSNSDVLSASLCLEIIKDFLARGGY